VRWTVNHRVADGVPMRWPFLAGLAQRERRDGDDRGWRVGTSYDEHHIERLDLPMVVVAKRRSVMAVRGRRHVYGVAMNECRTGCQRVHVSSR
jgi:hypothetical protein